MLQQCGLARLAWSRQDHRRELGGSLSEDRLQSALHICKGEARRQVHVMVRAQSAPCHGTFCTQSIIGSTGETLERQADAGRLTGLACVIPTCFDIDTEQFLERFRTAAFQLNRLRISFFARRESFLLSATLP
jgi:hypothetical protein